MSKNEVAIGGQAVIEGVMIMGKGKYAVSVRKPDKSIKTKIFKLKKTPQQSWKKLPFIRGFFNLVAMLVIGMKSLTWSANESTDDEEEKISSKEIAVTITFSMFFAVGLFFFLPYFLTTLIGYHEETNPILFNLVDGIIRIIFFIAYIYLISLMKDIRIMFQYHGAEHMAVHCYENNKKLTPKNASKFSRLHPRCGTSFMLIVMFISIVVFSVIPSIYMYLFPTFLDWNTWLRKSVLFITRVILIPVVAGISYELLKASANYQDNPIVKAAIAPGMWLQLITTNKPTNKQLEVALASIKAVAPKSKLQKLT